MQSLDPGYTVEVDQIRRSAWDNQMLLFKDASFYQTWAFGFRYFGENGMSHILLKHDGALVAMAQVRLIKVPRLPIGMAYVSWGPMWQIKNANSEERSLRNIIRALFNEYVLRRGLFLRITPHILNIQGFANIRDLFKEEGYSWSSLPGQNVIIDLSPSLVEIRQSMHHKWRQTLRSAEKKNLNIVEGDNQGICQLASEVIRDMKSRKQFLGGNQKEILRLQPDLHQSQKLHLLVCLDNDVPVATIGWVTFGTVGIPLVGATGTSALKTKASYMLWWRMIEYYKNNGFCAVDIGSVNQKRNPGGFYFKTHILGKMFEEKVRYIGQFDACANSLLKTLFIGLFRMREAFRDVQSRF